MNIFYLSDDPIEAARAQCDRHVVKMILESAQMLSTAHHVLCGESPAYRPTHINHPSTVWVRSNAAHYSWLFDHFTALCMEYSLRYGKVHKSMRDHHKPLSRLPDGIPNEPFTRPPQCMYDHCKRDDTVEAYIEYYRVKSIEWSDAGRPMTWRKRWKS